jgi:hypothetical protein
MHTFCNYTVACEQAADPKNNNCDCRYNSKTFTVITLPLRLGSHSGHRLKAGESSSITLKCQLRYIDDEFSAISLYIEAMFRYWYSLTSRAIAHQQFVSDWTTVVFAPSYSHQITSKSAFSNDDFAAVDDGGRRAMKEPFWIQFKQCVVVGLLVCLLSCLIFFAVAILAPNTQRPPVAYKPAPATTSVPNSNVVSKPHPTVF